MDDSGTYRFGEGVRFQIHKDKITRELGRKRYEYGNGYRREYLYPYEDENLSLRHDHLIYQISKGEKKLVVNDTALSEFVDRVVLSAAMQESGEENYGITDVYDGQTTYTEHLIRSLDEPDSKYGKCKAKKADRRGRRGKKGEKGHEKKFEEILVEEVASSSTRATTEPSITISIKQFRKMVNAEVKGKARVIHDYYALQWNRLQDDRFEAYRGVLIWQDQCHKIEQEHDNCKAELNRIKAAYDALCFEMDEVKKAKRSRRNEAKQRRRKQHAGKSVSSSNAQMSLINAQNQTSDVTGASDDEYHR